jgi:DNA-binding GntR family transcriptional regulator
MKVEQTLLPKIVELLQSERLDAGAHVPAQWLADRLRVSRTPVAAALKEMHQRRWLRHEAQRGFFLTRAATTLAQTAAALEPDTVHAAYFQIADDVLTGALGHEVTERHLKAHYALTATQLAAVLARISQEGWASKNPGYGWTFSTMLTTPESLLQSYRLRVALEPAALLEPGYHVDANALAACRAAEHRLLAGGIETDSADALHERGVRFHETLVEGSGNPFFIDTIRRVNRVRRLLSYRSMQDRTRYRLHCEQHLHILDLIEQHRQHDAADALRAHLTHTLRNHEKIIGLLQR